MPEQAIRIKKALPVGDKAELLQEKTKERYSKVSDPYF
jgi:hypothetical protein